MMLYKNALNIVNMLSNILKKIVNLFKKKTKKKCI